jgi:hypothetical protein
MLPPQDGPSPSEPRPAALPRQRPDAASGDDELSPFDLLHGYIDLVLAEWRTLVRAEPWAALRPDRLMDSLPEMLPRILRQAAAGTPHLDDELSEFIAREHGYFRRGDGVPLAAIAEEWNHLKRACWKVLVDKGVPEEGAVVALQRLDALFDDAVGFSLRGYYWPELDELRGRGLERRTRMGNRRAGDGDRRGES